MDSARASERRKFADRRASLMFDVHLARSGHKPAEWTGNVHDSGAEPQPVTTIPLAGGSDADAELARLRGRS